MKVVCDRDSMIQVAFDSQVGVVELAQRAKVSPVTLRRALNGLSVTMQSASKIFHALGNDARLKFTYDPPQISART